MTTFDTIIRNKVNAALMNEGLEFGPLLRVVRKTLGLPLKVVCEDTGIESQRLRNYELQRFRREPQESDIQTLATYYGIPHDYLKFKLTRRLEALRQVRRVQTSTRILPR